MDYRMVTIRVVHVFLFSFKKLKPFFLSTFKMEHQEQMKEVCAQIAEIRRVIKETKKQLTKEQRQAVREYRRDVLGRTKQPVFEEWQQMARSIPSSHEF